jgi:hypothetical protein
LSRAASQGDRRAAVSADGRWAVTLKPTITSGDIVNSEDDPHPIVNETDNRPIVTNVDDPLETVHSVTIVGRTYVHESTTPKVTMAPIRSVVPPRPAVRRPRSMSRDQATLHVLPSLYFPIGLR